MLKSRCRAGIRNDTAAFTEAIVMKLNRVKTLVLTSLLMAFTVQSAVAADYAQEISAFRRANKLSSVTLDSKLNAFALTQAQSMSASGKVSHEVGGQFSVRVAKLRKSRDIANKTTANKAAENIAAGFLSFSETLKQWEDSPGHRENLLMPGARKVGVAYVANPKSPYRMFWAMVITD
jgi:uncharacterized protein YkwD